MPRLIHLNGPPGVGKSTVARMYADDHPGTLALDVDLVVSMLGGWREDFWGTLPIARGLAVALVRQHLSAGHDVLLPQLVTAGTEIAPYLTAVEETGSSYVEVVLLAGPECTVERFAQRASDGGDPVGRHLGIIIAAGEGDALLATIHADLSRYLRGRDPDVVVDASAVSPDDVHGEMCRQLEGLRPARPPG